MTPVKPRSISFSSPMIHALEAGLKTQTRRRIKPQPQLPAGILTEAERSSCTLYTADAAQTQIVCPYGKFGTLLYVKEIFLIDGPDREAPGAVHYQSHATQADLEWLKSRSLRWVPGRFMPRALARIHLELTGVDVERVQSISEEDARAEGCPLEHNADPRAWYQGVFESLNGKDAWAKNMWVWVLKFKVLEVLS